MRRSHPFATAGFLLVLHGCGAVQPAAEAKQPAAAAVWPAGPWPCMLAQAVVVRNEEAGCMAAGVHLVAVNLPPPQAMLHLARPWPRCLLLLLLGSPVYLVKLVLSCCQCSWF